VETEKASHAPVAARETDHLKHECGIFGIFGSVDASKLTYLGLYALQHRGQESAGIVSCRGGHLHRHRDMGMVHDVFTEGILEGLPGDSAIGHVRYSTAGSTLLKNAQPIRVDYARGSLAVAHNGNLVNAKPLRDELEASGSIFQSTSDSEVIVHLLARSKEEKLENSMAEALRKIEGAYSVVALNSDCLIAARDPHGFRPLCLGTLGDAYVVASESCAFDIVDAEFVRDIEPGEMVVIDSSGVRSLQILPRPDRLSMCIFELIYFARPDSVIFGRDVERMRHQMGGMLHREAPVDADLVIPVPDSSNAAALGYANASGIPFEMGLIRNHYIGRTFIEPSQSIRDFGAKLKYNPVKTALRGKRVIVVDDSIVRGTTSAKIVKMIKAAGASEVHTRISSPPITHPCFYGIDTPTRAELIGAQKTVEEIRRHLEVDTLHYLTPSGLIESVAGEDGEFCLACFTGDYPIHLTTDFNKLEFE
jgi:amidophosphoribosyltransferase